MRNSSDANLHLEEYKLLYARAGAANTIVLSLRGFAVTAFGIAATLANEAAWAWFSIAVLIAVLCMEECFRRSAQDRIYRRIMRIERYFANPEVTLKPLQGRTSSIQLEKRVKLCKYALRMICKAEVFLFYGFFLTFSIMRAILIAFSC